jgi:poly(3-hydroxybutyrate) depolymerase
MIDYLQENFCVETSQIYAAGKSNGGGFVGLLACDQKASKKIAAFAPVSGAFYLNSTTGKPPPCRTSRKLTPILEFHGFEDKTILYGGGNDSSDRGKTVGIVEWVNRWAKRDGFDPWKNDTESVCPKPYKPALRHSWDDTVIHYNISNLHHDWPSTYLNDDTKNNTSLTTCFDATAIIMSFFGNHTLPKD